MIARWIVLILLMAGSAIAMSGNELQHLASAASVEILVGGRLEGSGWFADGDGLIVTVAHATAGVKDKIEARLPSGTRLNATLIALDLGHDLALLRVPRGDKPFPFLHIATATPETGTGVWLYGTAMMRHHLLLSGTVARSSCSYEYRPEQCCYSRIYYVSSPSPPGTSGGCWLGSRGQVVGMQSGYISMDRNTVGITQVVPPQPISRLLRTRQPARTPDLGAAIEELWEKPKDFIAKFPAGSEGVVTVILRKGGPSQAAGLTTQSLVTGMDGHSVRERDELLDYIRTKQPGDTVALRILQPEDKTAHEVQVTLACVEENLQK